MASANKSRRFLEALLAFAATFALLYFGNGLNPIWPLMWIAPLPVLWFSLRASSRAAALVAGLAWLGGCLNLWRYLRVLGTPISAWFVIFGSAAVVFVLAVLLFRALTLRGAPFTALLSLPSLWVAFEYIRNLATPHGTAGAIAYSQIRFLPILQLASLTGPWGISFFLLLVPAGIALALHLRATSPAQSRRILATTLGALAALLIFGAVRLAIPQPGPHVRVGLIAADKRTAPAGTRTQSLLQDYAQRARTLALQGPQVIVLPEKIVAVTSAGKSAADSILQQLADQTHTAIVAGVDRESPSVAFNQARVYRPGVPVATYDKEHLLPPFEARFTPGTSLLQLHIGPFPWGLAICKDMDFIQPSRTYGRTRVGLMLVPAWDFNIDRAWHGHIAIMRAVEDGFSLVRSAKFGYLTVTDNRGRILAERRSDAAPFATLLASVPAGHSWTLFQLLGNWFAWLSIALAAFSTLRLARLRK